MFGNAYKSSHHNESVNFYDGYLQFSPHLVCFLYHPGNKINNICYFITHVSSIIISNKQSIFMFNTEKFHWLLNLNHSDESKVIRYLLLLLYQVWCG